jgi:hypothetical protein|tara:strand:- start:628 stop:825 length:198 start_codon:yes stop_codon:yes gene_type:complete
MAQVVLSTSCEHILTLHAFPDKAEGKRRCRLLTPTSSHKSSIELSLAKFSFKSIAAETNGANDAI